MNNLKALKKSIFYISFPFSIIGLIFPIYAYSTGASVMEIGWVYSIFSLCTILMRPLVGKLIDKRGRKPGILIGLLFYLMVNVLFILGKDLKYLMLAKIFQSIAGSFFWISVDTMIYDVSSKKNRSESFGSINEVINRGSFFGSFIGFNLLYMNTPYDSIKVMFLIYLLGSIISIYYGITRIEETLEFKKDIQTEKSIQKEPLNRTGNFKIFLLISGLFALISSMTAHIYLIYIIENILNENLIYLFLPGAILSIFLPGRIGKISDKYSREKIMILGIIFTGLFTLFIPIAKSFYHIMLIEILLVIAGMFYGPAKSGIIIDFVGNDHRGTNYGIYKLVIGIGAIIGPLIGAYIYEHIGNTMVFYIEGILLIGICLLTAKLLNIRWGRDEKLESL